MSKAEENQEDELFLGESRVWHALWLIRAALWIMAAAYGLTNPSWLPWQSSLGQEVAWIAIYFLVGWVIAALILHILSSLSVRPVSSAIAVSIFAAVYVLQVLAYTHFIGFDWRIIAAGAIPALFTLLLAQSSPVADRDSSAGL